MATIQPTSSSRSTGTPLVTPGRMLRASLPLLSAFGYVASITALAIRMADGEDAISNEGVKYCLIASSTPLAVATTITGVDAVKQLCTNGYKEAKRIVMESVKPEGLIRRTLLPSKELEIMGESVAEMEYARGKSF